MCDSLKMPLEEVELSMGMSNDFEHAVRTFPYLGELSSCKKQFCVTSFNKPGNLSHDVFTVLQLLRMVQKTRF